jgi:hypothetical protein
LHKYARSDAASATVTVQVRPIWAPV